MSSKSTSMLKKIVQIIVLNYNFPSYVQPLPNSHCFDFSICVTSCYKGR